MKVYVASSWRNEFQQETVRVLREAEHEVYDFRNPPHGKGGFGWSQIGKEWLQWTPKEYLAALGHDLAQEGFKSDMDALKWCEACVYVMPCGPSASMEMGWACGSGRKVIAYIPALREPDLMVKMADFITDDLSEVVAFLARCSCRWCAAGYARVASAVVPDGFVHLFSPRGRVRCTLTNSKQEMSGQSDPEATISGDAS